MQQKTPVALTIAGSDPSGGAGIQADLKTFHQHKVFGMSVLTLLTVQNTESVTAVKTLEPRFVTAQLEAVLKDITPHAAKTGALGGASIIEAIAETLRGTHFPLVVDPVMISKHGASLIADEAIDALKKKLLPLAYLVTPNLAEAAKLAAIDVEDEDGMRRAAERIAALGPKNVLIKGGHLPGSAVDILLASGSFHRLPSERLATKNTHGTGCTLSAAITARLAGGEDLPGAVAGAKKFVWEAIRSNPSLGRGCGPVNHFAATD